MNAHLDQIGQVLGVIRTVESDKDFAARILDQVTPQAEKTAEPNPEPAPIVWLHDREESVLRYETTHGKYLALVYKIQGTSWKFWVSGPGAFRAIEGEALSVEVAKLTCELVMRHLAEG